MDYLNTTSIRKQFQSILTRYATFYSAVFLSESIDPPLKEILSKTPFGNFTTKFYKSIIELIKLYEKSYDPNYRSRANLFSCGNSKANSELQPLLEGNYRILESCCYTKPDNLEELLTRIKIQLLALPT